MTMSMSLCYVLLAFLTLLTLVPVRGSSSESIGDFQSVLNGFFEELIRKRRELPKRKDEAKEGFDDVEKDAMMLLHNSFRSVVSPTATNMIEVTWDNDIEAFAQEWANLCGGEHRANRDLNEWKNMGENLYWWTGAAYDEKRPTEWWFNERDYYDFDAHSCQPFEICSHYITMAWAKSAKIGCGIKRCDSIPNIVDRKAYYFVCNYSGRFLSNLTPYEKGTACSNCPAEFPKCRYNLCVSEAMFTGCQGYNGSLTWAGVERPSTQSDSMNCPGFEGNDGGGGGGGSETSTEEPTTDAPGGGGDGDTTDAPTDAPGGGDGDTTDAPTDAPGGGDDTTDSSTDSPDDDDSSVMIASSMTTVIIISLFTMLVFFY